MRHGIVASAITLAMVSTAAHSRGLVPNDFKIPPSAAGLYTTVVVKKPPTTAGAVAIIAGGRAVAVSREVAIWPGPGQAVPSPRMVLAAVDPDMGGVVMPKPGAVEGLPEPERAPSVSPSAEGRVMPASCVQRGQLGDRRRTHRHAGIDCGGRRGSPIVASFAGIVLPRAGRDRGYGPHVALVKGDDGVVYRYAHLDRVSVSVGQRVATGQALGTMGATSKRGYSHLHFETMWLAEFRKRPYGARGRIDPNTLLGGRRGTTMVAGLPALGTAPVMVAGKPSDVSARRAIRPRSARRGRPARA